MYTSSPLQVLDTLPALMNSIKMIHTIARYYNTTDRMTTLFVKVTNEMIANCQRCITGGEPVDRLWNKDPQELVEKLEACLGLNEAYQEQYRLTKDKLLTMPKGKQFDFSETQIFGKFDLFCRRVIKLIDMFSTIQQFKSLASHNMEGMENLISNFFKIIDNFRAKRHDLLNYHNNQFDRDFVEFNVKISELEGLLQSFINQSFENITSIESSLGLLKLFQNILQRENLKTDLDEKFNTIFQNYGLELEQVQHLYEKHKHDPPIPRNLPPVAGNITWSRHLLKRIEEPMKRFEGNNNVLATKEAKRIIKTYNKVARTLVAFEYLWYQAWRESIETAKAGLQATLIIRHPEDERLYVNFDQEILQLIREAKCLDRMGIEIPESAKIVLLQEDKFKSYFNDLQYALKEYERVSSKIIPVTAALLKPHINDMEYKLRPGMITLTWTSMNIDAYKHHIHSGLHKLEELVHNINDIIENRIEKNLKMVSKSLLVTLPDNESLSLEDFVTMQENFIDEEVSSMQGKNVQVENAVDDLVQIVCHYPLDAHIEPVLQVDIENIRRHYNHFMYQALLNCSKNSLNALKKRIGARNSTAFGDITAPKPFFHVDVQLSVPSVRLSPRLDEIQKAINKAAQAVLGSTKEIFEWGQQHLPKDTRLAFFNKITQDIEIVRVCLLLTGSIQGTKNQVREYLLGFKLYDWLWRDEKDLAYKKFMQSAGNNPALEEYEHQLKQFVGVETEIDEIIEYYNIGALCLNTKNLKLQFKHECQQWKVQYSTNLHKLARDKIEKLSEYMKSTMGKLHRQVNDLDALRFVMGTLKEVRSRESGIVLEISPILDMYTLLENYLPEGYMKKEEMDQKSVLRSTWRKLADHAEEVTDELTKLQIGFKKNLLKDIKEFTVEIIQFRNDYLANGPMQPGLAPKTAVSKLKRYQEDFALRWRKFELYHGGEELFALKHTTYPELLKTKKELYLQEQLYGLYTDVIDTLETWKAIHWTDTVANIEHMTQQTEEFQARCKTMPSRLRSWEAFSDLKNEIDNFAVVLPLLQELSKDSIKARHWAEVMKITGKNFNVDSSDFSLNVLLDAALQDYNDDILEVTEGADKQMSIEQKIAEIRDRWAAEQFFFGEWQGRGVPILRGVGPIIEELEEAQMQCQTMLTMRHVAPFAKEVQGKLTQLSDTSDTLERWFKVQLLWCSLESVFTGGDIAKQMPLEAKKFAKIDKDFGKVMARAHETANVVACCSNEILKTSLPVMYSELEKCQKSLEGYLEQKRNSFPRFYFVSNSVLLQILSKGSDPLAIQPFYETIFESIAKVVHDKADKTLITDYISRFKDDHEILPFLTPVVARGNIEDWLASMLTSQCSTMKDFCRMCALSALDMGGANGIRGFVDGQCAQYALLGIQIMWTAECQSALELCKHKKNVMTDTNKHNLAVLTELSKWCLEDLGTRMKRQKIETLVTIQVHQRDAFSDINQQYKQKKVTGPSDFIWLRQARFYWRPDEGDQVDDDGRQMISVTDVDFSYQYEYLGVKDRLCITPLTDRCYITLAQALGMHLGGAPAGPAGTGKTETVKDMGRTLGIYVMVTNCTDQQRHTDMAKIFKGLCQAGLWGCFDEFNRITLPVLSVVAQQVLAITNAKKGAVRNFQFPGDPQTVSLDPVCGFFITMNPGYAGRQELPENLKALFRGVAMMVPNRDIIIKVKLCSVGFKDYEVLGKKFQILYQMCEEQLSAQKHYDFGLRNILSVLRTAGQTKRDHVGEKEAVLLYQTLRDMNLSKLVAQDVPLFLSLLRDLFPSVPAPPSSSNDVVQLAIQRATTSCELVQHASWTQKVMQLYDTHLVRHGIMICGPAGAGKTQIIRILQKALTEALGIQHKEVRLNPKAVRAPELYGEVDPVSGEWTTGVFAAIWRKFNRRENKFITWIIEDGPVDSIWIEDLNTVLDDNRILTLANSDRIPMTDNTKILFENENLDNASPATVSRAGIIWVSETDLDWAPVAEAWVMKQSVGLRDHLRALMLKWVGENTSIEKGHLFDFIDRACSDVLKTARVAKVSAFLNLMNGLFQLSPTHFSGDGSQTLPRLERIFVYAVSWSLCGLLEVDDRKKVDEYLRNIDGEALPICEGGETVYEYTVDPDTMEWVAWEPPVWDYPDLDDGQQLNFSTLLVPTTDTTRALFNIRNLHKQGLSTLLVGGLGTAKTSIGLMFMAEQDPNETIGKLINFSSATTPGMFQKTVEASLDKRGGKNFGPPNGKKMLFFMDDMSMPLMNNWGDQPTLEIVRQIIETKAVAFLDKDKRGDMKVCEDLQWLAAMAHPMGGKNDIPNRLKRHFMAFNLVLPSLTSINDIYGQMLDGRFTEDNADADFLEVVGKLTEATIRLWETVKAKMLPTPAKFHYTFSMRELSRVFQGVLLCPRETFLTGGIATPTENPSGTLLNLWKHECERVFCDKLVDNADKFWFQNTFNAVTAQSFGPVAAENCVGDVYFVDFLRDDTFDEDGVMLTEAPKVYEPGGTLAMIGERVTMFLDRFNSEFPAKAMNLVLFEDALRHLLRISRILGTPRGSIFLVGVGGSGKRSLAKVAAYISGSSLFQIALTKNYNVASLMDDLRFMYKQAGAAYQSTTFLFTEGDIEDENFLEYVNTLLLTGNISGLFAKDEMIAMTAELQDRFATERPGQPDSQDNLNQFFIDCVRDNLHVVLCMSPVSAKFSERARFFPGLISCCTIDIFLAWPLDALVTVSAGLIQDFPVECEPEEKAQLIGHMAQVHRLVQETCVGYFQELRRHIYQTPKSYLSFIQNYKTSYTAKLNDIKLKEKNVNMGLQKLIQGASDVEAMKGVLASEQVKLEVATIETNKMLGSLEISSLEAKKESDFVATKKTKCEADATRISAEKNACLEDLAKAQPFVTQAEEAINSIQAKDINIIKKLPKPLDIIKLVFDGVCILFMKPLVAVQQTTLVLNKKDTEFIEPSFSSAQSIMADTHFRDHLIEFGRDGKDHMNEETVELLTAYIDIEDFLPSVAKKASQAAEGLCTFVRAMKYYYEASKIVKPKLEALSVAEAHLSDANANLAEAEASLGECRDKVAKLQETFENQVAEKQRIENNARGLEKKMGQASALINGLAGERIRWTEESNNFAATKRRLVGDCAVSCAFTCYCGPFNQPYREKLVTECFTADCLKRNLPVSQSVDIVAFQSSPGDIGDWNMQGLPTDDLSTQNGILVTKSERYPLLIDPQGQALHWLGNREKDRLQMGSTTQLNNPKLKDQLEFCMAEGKALVIVGVEEELDPLLDPVLAREVTLKGRTKYITVQDKPCEYVDTFTMYFITRMANPHFSPELQAKTTVVDFTVTMEGLEEQLLGLVIGKEQKSLEEQLNDVLAQVNSNRKALANLDELLLERLSANEGSLLEDEELIEVLANTKAKAADVSLKLEAAGTTRKNIGVKREQFRPVARRGSVLYFSIVEMSGVNVMYETSLAQFLELFMASMDHAEKATLAQKRVGNICGTMTEDVFEYINAGLFEKDKLAFAFILTVKILVAANTLRSSDIALFLRAGASLDIQSVRVKPHAWLTDDAWLNVVQLSQEVPLFKNILDDIHRNDAIWKRWYESNNPESESIPDYELRIAEEKEIGSWCRLLAIRALRMDRCMLATRDFIRHRPEMGPQFVDAMAQTIDKVYNKMTPSVPVIFLLSVGADPTEAIEVLCRRKKQTIEIKSMGQGQEAPALNAINTAALNGSWVFLQNCELGLELMDQLEELMEKMKPTLTDDFRFFMSAAPHPKFPLGLLQMCTKVTNEPPAGLRAGLLRSYSVMVDQERIERVETSQWRQLLYGLCFLHSVVQERRKFGPLGFCIPYEFNTSDLSACVMFLEKHLYSGPISWPTFQYMVAEAQYGGKITDEMDSRLFQAYAKAWVCPDALKESFSYNPAAPIQPIPDDFRYSIPDAMDVTVYRQYVTNFPEVDSPEIFGLHPNADITFRVKEVNGLLQTLDMTQPKTSGGGSGQSREDIVYDKAGELLLKLPEDYVAEDYKPKIRALGGTEIPLNIFLYQEIQQLQKVRRLCVLWWVAGCSTGLD